MNVRCSSRTPSSSRARSIVQVMRNDEVAIPRTAIPFADRAAEPRRTDRVAHPRLFVQVLLRQDERQPIAGDVQLLAGDVVLIEQLEHVFRRAIRIRLEHQHFTLAGDAHHCPRRMRRMPAYDRAVG